jgi:hypothetical protein
MRARSTLVDDDRLVLGALCVLVLAGIALRGLLLGAQSPGFTSSTDAPRYLIAAHVNVFLWTSADTAAWPAGYPTFLRAVYALDHRVSFIIWIQHALGIGTALLWFLTVRRVANAAWGLLPAAIVLLAGPQLFLEHAPMTECLFGLLIAGLSYAAVRARHEQPLPWSFLAGLLAAAAATVRVVGILYVAVVGAWLFLGVGGGLRKRLTSAAALAAGASLVLGAYLIEMKRETGFGGPALTHSGGWTVPGGTHEPAAYLSRIGTDLTRYWNSDDRDYVAGYSGYNYAGLAYLITSPNQLNSRYTYDYLTQGLRTSSAATWYPTGATRIRSGPRTAMLKYEKHTRLEGVAFLALVLLALVGVAFARGDRLSVGLFLVVIAAVTLLTPILYVYYDARYVVPGYGPLAAAAAVGGAALWERLASARVSRAPSPPDEALATQSTS